MKVLHLSENHEHEINSVDYGPLGTGLLDEPRFKGPSNEAASDFSRKWGRGPFSYGKRRRNEILLLLSHREAIRASKNCLKHAQETQFVCDGRFLIHRMPFQIQILKLLVEHKWNEIALICIRF